ncbi:Peptidase C2, calpain, domain III,Peptidase C2, calpain, large subunit, domain III,Peptidase C2, calpain [Cinara cedri]|uniref:Peptidase C2, calpain, domain III,Peptidase C2, calpain, large subunit, domain III,Peptidase C2, calpain n=1 Tax=Cinara cedri TaxID=506608 RepID=A0A5E4MDY8_9HEMI|nr:Peptidase C2, calpain, domain III,Peptidase C2, calpain, large subunit, domain III,Peptidase C2, calpain [Cinara cedri]
MGCGHSDRKSSDSRSTASASSSTDQQPPHYPARGHRRDPTARCSGDDDDDAARYCTDDCGAVPGFRTSSAGGRRSWTEVGFPVHRITKIMQVEQVDICEEQNNSKFINTLRDDYNNSKGFPEILSIQGSWIYGLNAGGSRNNLDMFETNPQYLLKFSSGLIEEDHLFITIKILLKVKRLNKKNPLYVAFFLYKNDFQQKETLGSEYFLCTEPEGSSGMFKAKQLVSETFVVSTLASYVIVPATFKPFQQGEFVIKVMVDRKLGTKLIKLIPPTRPSVGNINIQ